VLAQRYRWFCEAGWRLPTLNHPSIIHGTAKAKDVDQLIVDGIRRWMKINESIQGE